MVSTFVLLTLINLFQALEIFCQNLQSFKLSTSNSYNISIINPPEETYFLIGKENEYPELEYNYSSGEWISKLSIYSVTQYYLQATNLYVGRNYLNESINLSICSFKHLNGPFNLAVVEKDPSECDPRCSIYGKKCSQANCVCNDGYFGRSCELKLHIIYSGYSKSFKALPYSLTFFKINTDSKLFFKDKQDTTHIFFAKKYIPSFFVFDNYRTQNKSDSSGSFDSFTVFCASDQSCHFQISSETEVLSLSRVSIIAISVVLGVLFFIVIIAVIIKLRCARNRMKNNNLNEAELDEFAPKEKFSGPEDTCSICLNDFTQKEEIRKIKKCNHVFHVNCIDAWLIQKAVCPNCNKRLK